ncbi:MAG: 4-hydroxy-tetrahydrodipicolinate synthase [Dehalococcoidia bacterium]|nr:4-hydroxy-tetrahydrodipicolinate synthase [Dehalococcoidia bacterium]
MDFTPHGVVPAMVTPFDHNDRLAEPVLRALVERLLNDGVHGVFVLGSQGEYFALDMDEKKRAIEIVVETVNSAVPVYAGTGATTTREAIYLTQMAEALGANAVSVITPAFISPNVDELYEYYRDIANSTRLPVLLYSNPGRTGIQISADLAHRLSHIENIVGIKDSSGDLSLTADYIRKCGPSFRVFAGRDTLILATLLYGGAGTVAATANVAARLIVSIYDHYMAGNLDAARAAQSALAPLRAAFSLGTFPAVVKEALGMTGLDVGPARKPVGPLSEGSRAQLRDVLDTLGLLQDSKS